MANILDLLNTIKDSKYGKDVRQSIHDAIQQCYNDATGNPESIAEHVADTENAHGIGDIKNPEFEDYTADGAEVPDARTAISELTTKMSLFTFLGKVKAALMGLVTLGEMRALLVNNGLTTETGKYFLDAAFGKTLADKDTELAALIAQLNSDLNKFIPNSVDRISIPEGGTYTADTNGYFYLLEIGSSGQIYFTGYEGLDVCLTVPDDSAYPYTAMFVLAGFTIHVKRGRALFLKVNP